MDVKYEFYSTGVCISRRCVMGGLGWVHKLMGWVKKNGLISLSISARVIAVDRVCVKTVTRTSQPIVQRSVDCQEERRFRAGDPTGRVSRHRPRCRVDHAHIRVAAADGTVPRRVSVLRRHGREPASLEVAPTTRVAFVSPRTVA